MHHLDPGVMRWPLRALPEADRARFDSVHVWSEWVDDRAGLGTLLELLDDDEQARAGRFHFDRDRARFVARRAFLRSVLAGYLGMAPARVRYRRSANGKPELAGTDGISFSATHSDGLATVAVATGRLLGVDVERIRPIPDAVEVAARVFTRREHEHVASVAEPARSSAFLRLWTRKESYVKAIGAGMSLAFTTFDVLDGEDGLAPRLPGTDAGPTIGLVSLDGPHGYIGSVAASGSPVTLKHISQVARQ